MSRPNPFAEIETRLADPGADGVFVYHVGAGAPLEEAGLRPGDIVEAIDGEALAQAPALIAALQAPEPEAGPVALALFREGKRLTLTAPRDKRGVAVCSVKKGVPAWLDAPDTDYEPDLSTLERGAEIWLRMMLDDKPAGFERLLVRPDGEHLEVDTLFWMAGEMEPGKTWDYCTHTRSLHALDRQLSCSATEAEQGVPGERRLTGRVARGADGRWRGVHVPPAGEKVVDLADRGIPAITTMSATLLPLTMPLEAGARLTFAVMGDGTGVVTARHRLECLGRRTVERDGGPGEAWAFAWLHYGGRTPGEDEVFYVSDERRLVRIEWGPAYGNCWCIAVPKERVLDGAPAHVELG